jgi:hypothetical protein
VVWFTTRRVWEPTATTLIQPLGGDPRPATETEIKVRLGGKVRVGVAPETAPYDFADFERMSGVDPKIAAGLVEIARRDGSDPRDRGSALPPSRQRNG